MPIAPTRRFLSGVLALSLLLLQAPQPGAAADKALQHLRGTVGYEAGGDGRFKEVATTLVLQDNAVAVTRAQSTGLVTLPDSSEVELGENTRLQVGAFTQAEGGAGSTFALQGGKIRFNVRRPSGGKSNYTFSTVTSTTSVRGTVGLLSSDANGDTIACLACEPGDVIVTVKDRAYTLVTGQVIKISLAGIVIGATLAAVVSQFAGAGVATSASSASVASGGAAGAGGAGAGAGAGGAAGGAAGAAGASTAAIAAGVAAAAAAAAVISNNNTSNTPVPQQSGTITLGSSQRKPQASPRPTPTPSPAPAKSPQGVK